MTEYTDGLAWAAINVCKLKFMAGSASSYYISAAIMLTGSILALLFPSAVAHTAAKKRR